MSHYYRATSQQFAGRQQRMWRRNQNITSFAPSVALGPVSHTILIAMMVAVLGLLYLTQVTKTSGYSYDINTLEQRLESLTLEKEELTNQNARLSALKNVENSDVAKAMTAPSTTNYAN
jgi:hypothetical protein